MVCIQILVIVLQVLTNGVISHITNLKSTPGQCLVFFGWNKVVCPAGGNEKQQCWCPLRHHRMICDELPRGTIRTPACRKGFPDKHYIIWVNAGLRLDQPRRCWSDIIRWCKGQDKKRVPQNVTPHPTLTKNTLNTCWIIRSKSLVLWPTSGW